MVISAQHFKIMNEILWSAQHYDKFTCVQHTGMVNPSSNCPANVASLHSLHLYRKKNKQTEDMSNHNWKAEFYHQRYLDFCMIIVICCYNNFLRMPSIGTFYYKWERLYYQLS